MRKYLQKPTSKTLVLLRDRSLNDETIKYIKNANFQSYPFLELTNLQKYVKEGRDPPFIDLLRTKIW